ncbi:MAG TPA: hypothetical protein VGP07_23100 [Polyangia bacterium]|jgi:hypothetical protein
MSQRPRSGFGLARVLVGFSMLALLLAGGTARAAKPEDVFKGKIMITKDRLPMRFSSPGAFVSAIQSKKTDKIWPTEENGADHGKWNLEYVAFFAQPLNDSEIQIKFYDITGGDKKFIAGDPQYTREKGSRIFSASIELAKPEFDVNKHYMMTIESGHRVIALTTFWLRGKGANYSGKVEFSDEDTKKH